MKIRMHAACVAVALLSSAGVLHAQQGWIDQQPPASQLLHGGWNVQPIGDTTAPAAALAEPEKPYYDGATSCDGGCTSGCVRCCKPAWVHRSGVFGEYLYLRARDTEVVYSTPVDGAAVAPPRPPVQMGRLGIVDPDYSSAFRVGFSIALDDCSSTQLSYTHFETNTQDLITTQPGAFLQAMLLHPSTVNAATNALLARANYNLEYEFIDWDYRAIWSAGDCYAVNFLVGGRWGKMDQTFNTFYTLAGTNENVGTSVNFDGGGIRFGVDGERYLRHGFLMYAKGVSSFLAGEYRGRFQQASNFDPSVVDAQWRAGRLVTILDLELGGGWQSNCGRWRATYGYMISTWQNTVQTDEFIQAVRTNNFVGLDDKHTFDGFVGRIEYRH